MKDWLSFIFSKKFVLHILLICIVFILLIFATFYWFKIYTNHGEYITLNNLNELTFEQTVDLLEEKGLNYYIVDSTSYNPDYLPHAVIQQNPAAQSKVKSGRTIYLWLNAKKPPFKKIPCLMGEATLQEAFERLPQVGFSVGEITYVPLEGVKQGNPILKMNIDDKEVKCGDKAKYGTKIDLKVGEKVGANKVAIPLLLGKTIAEAEFQMNNDLNFGSVIYDQEGLIDSSTAIIYKQLPNYTDNEVRVGSTIDVWLMQDMSEELAKELQSIKSDTTSNK